MQVEPRMNIILSPRPALLLITPPCCFPQHASETLIWTNRAFGTLRLETSHDFRIRDHHIETSGFDFGRAECACLPRVSHRRQFQSLGPPSSNLAVPGIHATFLYEEMSCRELPRAVLGYPLGGVPPFRNNNLTGDWAKYCRSQKIGSYS